MNFYLTLNILNRKLHFKLKPNDIMTTIEFNTQLMKLENQLNYFAISLTNDDEDAKDLVQDTLVKAIVNQDKFRDDTNLKAWTYTIMKNTFINNYRRNQKNNTLVDATNDQYFINSSVHNQDLFADSRNNTSQIVAEIKKLDLSQRKPFEMHIAGFKYKEIADHMNISIGTVKSRIFSTRKKLMNTLKDFEN